jgi:P2 family phage contractile tail tube protein
MALAINRITNANVYMNGTSFLGTCEEIMAPEIIQTMTEHKALGMHGSVEFPSGVDKMEGKLKMNSYYEGMILLMANANNVVQLQIRGSMKKYTGAVVTDEVPVIIYMDARFKKVPMGNFKQKDNVEFESEYSAYSLKLEIDGENIVEFDAMNNIYKVNGIDVLATYRANIGG